MIILQSTLSDAELCRLVGATRGAVRDWRIGRQRPSGDRAAALAWLDTIARTTDVASVHDTVWRIAGRAVHIAGDGATLDTSVDVDGHSAQGWCGSGVCLLRLVSEAIRLAEREGVV